MIIIIITTIIKICLIIIINSLIEGKCRKDFVHILFGGRLLAMNKKFVGIRPIVVGNVWRRLAVKYASAHAIDIADYFTPLQLGVGVPGGCEAVVHATRRFHGFLFNMPVS